MMMRLGFSRLDMSLNLRRIFGPNPFARFAPPLEQWGPPEIEYDTQPMLDWEVDEWLGASKRTTELEVLE